MEAMTREQIIRWGAENESNSLIRRQIQGIVDGKPWASVESTSAMITAFVAEKTAVAAKKRAYFKKRATCAHSWEMISHEEKRCRNCGETRFVGGYVEDI